MRSGLIDSGTAALPLRFLRRRPLGAVMSMAGVALGVTLVVAVTILWTSLQAVLNQYDRQGFGDYAFSVKAPTGLLEPGEARRAAGLPNVKAVVEVLMLPAPGAGAPVDQYIGIGRFPQPDQAYRLKQGRYPGPHEAVAPAELAAAHGWKVGDTLAVAFQRGILGVRLSGIRASTALESGESPRALLFDLAWLQEQVDLPGRSNLLLIEILAGDERDLVAANLNRYFGSYQLHRRADTDRTHLSLRGLRVLGGLVACTTLAAALFLVTGSFVTATHERARELAVLRALGATPDQTVRLILQEAGILGAAGSLAGVAAGWAAARLALGAVSANAGLAAESLTVPWVFVALEACAGTAIAVVAARQPARAAGALAPMAVMRPQGAVVNEAPDDRPRAPWLMAAGAAIVLAAQPMDPNTVTRGYVSLIGALLFAVGLVASAPVIMVPCVKLLTALARVPFPVEATLAARSLIRHRQRSALTVSISVLSLLLLVSTGAIATESQVNTLALAKPEVPSRAVIEAPSFAELPASLRGQVSAIAGVSVVAVRGVATPAGLVDYDWRKADPQWLAERRANSPVPDAEKRVTLLPLDEGTLASLTGEMDAPAGAIVSRQRAQQLGLKPGDAITLVTYDQMRVFQGGGQGKLLTVPVTGIVDSLPYMWEHAIAVPNSLVQVPLAALYLDMDPARAPDASAAIQALLQAQGLGLAEFRDFVAEAERIRSQHQQVWVLLGAGVLTVTAISALSLLTVIIAGLQARRRELATLRALGSTPVQMARQVLLESMVLAVTGGLVGLAGSGGVLAALVFGTGLKQYQPPLLLGTAAVAAGVLLAALAGLGPALAVGRGSAAEVLRSE